MLKLKDIFNIDISSKGGGKLYKKIMRKYNIPIKDVKEVKQEIVECSSGGGEGVKEYYYKIIQDNIEESFYNTVIRMYAIGSMICKLKAYGSGTSWGNWVKASITTTNTSGIMGIHFIDIIDYTWDYMDYNDFHYAQKIPRGNIVDKLKYIGEENKMSQEELQAGIDLVNSMFQEITKEEYEAMITYKP